MPRFYKPISRHVAIVSALLAGLPGVILAQQDKPGAALPPPSLYDSGGAPLPPRPDAQPAPARASPTVAPTAAAPAAQAQQATPSGKNSDYATDSPNKTIRTGARGQCVKLGTTSPDARGEECEPGAAAAQQSAPQPTTPPPTLAPAAPTAAASAQRAQSKPKAETSPEPVEVKPLERQPAKEERVLEPEPVQAAEPAPKPATAPAKETVTLAADALFSLGSAAIKATARQSLDEFLKKMKGVQYESIKIIGHTDPTGSAAQNSKLSLRRAQAVKRYLVAKGLDANKIQTEGLGGSEPLVTDKDCSKMPRAAKIVCLEPDRRVEIEVLRAMPKMTERQ